MMQEQYKSEPMTGQTALEAQDGKVPVTAVFTVIAAGAAAVAVMAMPVGMIEMLVSSVGLSEILPMAAPPLGMTARLTLAAVAAALAAALVWVLRRTPSPADGSDVAWDDDDASPEITDNQGAQKMGFALPKFMASLSRGRAGVMRDGAEDDGALARRRADVHPDAPPRRPIFASSDLSNVSLLRNKVEPRSFESEAEPRIITSGAGLRMPQAPDPIPVDVAEFAQDTSALVSPPTVVAEPIAQDVVAPAPAPALTPEYVPMGRPAHEEPVVSTRPLARPSLDDLDITALADRFETGLARRAALVGAAQASQRAEAAMAMMEPVAASDPVTPSAFTPPPSSLAAMPVAEPVAVKPNVDTEIDEALRAALGTLQRMTARAG